MRLRKKFAVASVVTALVAGVVLVAPAHAASKDLVVGITLDIDKLDPQAATSFATVRALGLVFGSLVEVGPKLDIRPGLATSWSFNAAGTQLRLHIRKGVKFQDGTSFGPEDVKASLQRILDPATKASARSNLLTIKTITVFGNDVILDLTIPNVPILAALDGVNMAMLSSKDIAAGTIGKTVNGTGPFSFVSWTPGQSVKLASNPTYWGHKPKLDTITFRIIPNESSILSALNAGTIQFSVITDPLIAKQVGKNLKKYATPSLAYIVLQINARKAPMDNLNVRLAIQCAISRSEVVKTAQSGEGTVIGPITSPAYFSNPNDRPCPNADIAKAKQLLTTAGYPNGITISTIVAPTQFATASAVAQSLKAQLAKAGITLNLEVVDDSTFISRWLGADFQTAIANNGGRIDPDTMYTRYFTSTGNLNKVAGYSSAKLDSLFALGKSTGNVAQRKGVYKSISEELETNAAWVWLFAPYEYRVASKKLTGFVPLATGSLLELRKADLS